MLKSKRGRRAEREEKRCTRTDARDERERDAELLISLRLIRSDRKVTTEKGRDANMEV